MAIRERFRNGKSEGWVVYYRDGTGTRRNKIFRKKREAQTYLAETVIAVRGGIHTPESTSITVAQAAELWLERGRTEKLEQSTLRQYAGHVGLHIIPNLGSTKLARLTVPMVEAFKDKLLREASRPMARKVLTSLKSILRDALRRGLVAQNAALGVKVETKKRARAKLAVGRDIPSKEEITAIFEAARGRWRPLIITAALTGLRASELRGLCWDSVDFERRVIHVRQRADLWRTLGAPKSAAGDREVPMSRTVVNVLREWKLACPPGELNLAFPTGAGTVESHANICNRGWYPAQIDAGVTYEGGAKYGLHGLRHFYASWAIEQGFSPKRVQALFGHSSIQMTFDVYGHLFPSLEDDHAKFDAAETVLLETASKWHPNGL